MLARRVAKAGKRRHAMGQARPRLAVASLLSISLLGCTSNNGATPLDPAAGHQVFMPDQINWQPAPPSLPAGAKVAVLEGDPAKPGFFTMRAWMPDGYRIPAHYHPN